ncbi:MAG: hypothetical protein IPK19_37910 [Chloroflexi bacterium]|nr:hypothetical protein [Chloroflexota bacterium]
MTDANKKDYIKLMKEAEVQISIWAVDKPEDNGYSERPMRISREQEVVLSKYADFHDA